MDHLSMK